MLIVCNTCGADKSCPCLSKAERLRVSFKLHGLKVYPQPPAEDKYSILVHEEGGNPLFV